MFGQLFGKYLVNKGVITQEDYKELIKKQLEVRVKLGTIAVADGLLSEEQAELVNKLQKQFDKRFGDIAIEKGFLTEAQVDELLKKQGNPYMKFLEVLLESGKVTISQADAEFAAFQKDSGFSNDDMNALKKDDFERLVPIYAFSSKPFVTDLVCLILRNINRFVTRDFYLGKIEHLDKLDYKCLAGQKTVGVHSIQVAVAGVDVRSFYGQKHFATNLGIMNFCLMVASFVATACSALLSATGGYIAPFVLLLSMSIAALGLNLSIKKP